MVSLGLVEVVLKTEQTACTSVASRGGRFVNSANSVKEVSAVIFCSRYVAMMMSMAKMMLQMIMIHEIGPSPFGTTTPLLLMMRLMTMLMMMMNMIMIH